MNTIIKLKKILLLAPLVVLFSCTDSTTDDGTSVPEQDVLFSDIKPTLFTGVYDTLGYTLLVNTIPQSQYDALHSNAINEDSLHDAICGEKEGGCMEAIEQYYISKVSDKVRRKDKALILSLTNGKSITLVNNLKEDDSYEVFQFQQLINGYYVVAVFYYESYGYQLINANNGKSTFTIGSPLLSPAQNQFASANYDMVAAFTFNGLELLTSTKDSAFSTLKIDFATWGPEEIKWKDDSTLYVKQKAQPEEGAEQKDYSAIRIRRHAGI